MNPPHASGRRRSPRLFVRPQDRHATPRGSWLRRRAHLSGRTGGWVWFCLVPRASPRRVQALVLICSTTGCPAFLIRSSCNKATFQTDQMLPATVSRGPFLSVIIIIRVSNSTGDKACDTHQSWRLYNCSLSTYLQKHFKTTFNYILETFLST